MSTSELSKLKQLLFITFDFCSENQHSVSVPPDAKAANLFAPFFDLSIDGPASSFALVLMKPKVASKALPLETPASVKQSINPLMV
jgi:hypothetical protein